MFIGQIDKDAYNMSPVSFHCLVVVDALRQAGSLDLEATAFLCQCDGVRKEHPDCVNIMCIKEMLIGEAAPTKGRTYHDILLLRYAEDVIPRLSK